jgi:hypothetical protein
MSDKIQNEHMQELREMVKGKKPSEPADEVIAVFCQRHGISLDTCRLYYNEIMKEDKVKEK